MELNNATLLRRGIMLPRLSTGPDGSAGQASHQNGGEGYGQPAASSPTQTALFWRAPAAAESGAGRTVPTGMVSLLLGKHAPERYAAASDLPAGVVRGLATDLMEPPSAPAPGESCEHVEAAARRVALSPRQSQGEAASSLRQVYVVAGPLDPDSGPAVPVLSTTWSNLGVEPFVPSSGPRPTPCRPPTCTAAGPRSRRPCPCRARAPLPAHRSECGHNRPGT